MAVYRFENHSAYDNVNKYNIEINELDDNSKKASQPSNAKILLKPHQLTLVGRCIDFENNKINMSEMESLKNIVDISDDVLTSIGIIGDNVGSGKSYSCLALISLNNIQERRIDKTYNNNYITYRFKKNFNAIKTSLIVTPHNLFLQWENYVKTFDPDFKYLLIDSENKINEIDMLQNYDIIIISDTHIDKFYYYTSKKKIRFQRIFYDEVDNLKISNQKFLTNFTWLVTASYGNLLYPRGFIKYNRVMDKNIFYNYGLKSSWIKNLLIDMVNNFPIDFIKVFIIKNNNNYIKNSFSIDPIVNNFIKCKTPYNIDILNGLVDKNIINCLNADDINGALTFISPVREGSQDNIINIIIDKYEKQIKNLNDRIYQNKNEKILLSKKNILSEKIKSIYLRIKNTTFCPICYESFQTKSITRCCSNSYCLLCIKKWLESGNNTCPLCKSNLNLKDLYVVNNEQNLYDKIHNLKVLLNKLLPESKILIFSEYELSSDKIISILNSLKIKWAFLKGNASQINSNVKKYSKEDLQVLLINSHNYGTGLNLENTTDLIMFHKSNTQIEQQIIGRAWRPGRTKILNVHYLLYENEFDKT